MVGEKIPSHPIKVVAYKDGEYTVTDAKTDEISNGKKIVIVGFPGKSSHHSSKLTHHFSRRIHSSLRKAAQRVL